MEDIMVRQPRILVVDDEGFMRNMMHDILEGEEFLVESAKNGKEALETLASFNPDVIILDAMMPVMSGFEVLEEIKSREETKTIQVVMLTALQNVNDRVRAIKAGSDDFITKPFEHLELLARVRSLVKVKFYYDHLHSYQQELEWEVEKRTTELMVAYQKMKSASLESIVYLSRAAEFKDQSTGFHINRIASYATILARKLGFDEEKREILQYAAPMHDIGKIGIPDSILLKPGPLDSHEWKIMQQHTEIGATILEGSDSEILQTAHTIALTHHEKWNGEGYPHGLKGEDIPLVGRIVAIVDVFDALTSERPYKKAFTIKESMAMIHAEVGSHFDPSVAAAFFELQDNIIKIRRAIESF